MNTASAAPTRASAAPTPTVVSTGILQRQCECGQHTLGGAECDECKNKRGVLQRFSATTSRRPTAPPIVHAVLRLPGNPLDETTREVMGSYFGRDFSHVRVHTGPLAEESTRAVSAHAYTVQNNIVFGSGKYAPHAPAGRKLLAHELTHVVQQGKTQASRIPERLELGPVRDPAEREAESVANRVHTGRRIEPKQSVPPLVQGDFKETAEGAAVATGIFVGVTTVLGGIGVGIAAALGAFKSKKPKNAGPSLENPVFRKKWEASLEKGLVFLEKIRPAHGCEFPGRGDELQYDQDNWELVGGGNLNMMMGTPVFKPRAGKPFDAVRALFTNLDKWKCDCRLFGEISLLYAWYDSLQDHPEQFNERFAGLTLSPESTTGIKRTINQNVDDTTWKNAPVGSKVVWENCAGARAPWQFEHAIKRHKGKPNEDDLYAAQGIGFSLTEKQIKLAMAEQCPDYPRDYTVTDQTLNDLKADGVAESILKDLATIKNQTAKGTRKFLEMPPLRNLRLQARQDPDQFSKLINNILNRAGGSVNPKEAEQFAQDNVVRNKIEVPK